MNVGCSHSCSGRSLRKLSENPHSSNPNPCLPFPVSHSCSHRIPSLLCHIYSTPRCQAHCSEALTWHTLLVIVIHDAFDSLYVYAYSHNRVASMVVVLLVLQNHGPMHCLCRKRSHPLCYTWMLRIVRFTCDVVSISCRTDDIHACCLYPIVGKFANETVLLIPHGNFSRTSGGHGKARKSVQKWARSSPKLGPFSGPQIWCHFKKPYCIHMFGRIY